jgi:hypothetical protein
MGDFWSRLNYLLKDILDNKDNKYILHCTTQGRKIWIERLLSLINFPDKDRIEVNSKTTPRKWTDSPETYKCEYFPTVKTWTNPSTPIIAYSFEANWNKDKKIPPWVDKILVDPSLEKYNKVKVGLPMQIEECVDVLSKCSVFVSVDNGMAHVARSVGCPHIIIKHEWGLERGFPRNVYSYDSVESLANTLSYIKRYIG